MATDEAEVTPHRYRQSQWFLHCADCTLPITSPVHKQSWAINGILEKDPPAAEPELGPIPFI